MCGVHQHLQNTWALVKADKCLYTLCQRSHVTNDNQLKHFDSQVTVLETFGGILPNNPLIVDQNLIKAGVRNPNYASDSERKRAEKAVVED